MIYLTSKPYHLQYHSNQYLFAVVKIIPETEPAVIGITNRTEMLQLQQDLCFESRLSSFEEDFNIKTNVYKTDHTQREYEDIGHTLSVINLEDIPGKRRKLAHNLIPSCLDSHGMQQPQKSTEDVIVYERGTCRCILHVTCVIFYIFDTHTNKHVFCDLRFDYNKKHNNQETF